MLKEKLVELKKNIEFDKKSAALSHFNEKLEELMAMGAQLMEERYKKGWVECREKVSADFIARFPEVDFTQVDPNREAANAPTQPVDNSGHS